MTAATSSLVSPGDEIKTFNTCASNIGYKSGCGHDLLIGDTRSAGVDSRANAPVPKRASEPADIGRHPLVFVWRAD
jgi:hypothetical protein